MKKISLLPLAILLLSALAVAQRSNRNTNYNTHNSESDSCQDQIDMYSEDQPAQARSEETVTIANQPLKVTASRNGGIRVKNWDKQEFSVKICRLAAGRTESEAQQTLSKIRLASQNGVVAVEGPESTYDRDSSWSTVLLIYAPVGSTMDLN